MHPTSEQIGRAAYDRWERRHHVHGRHHEDWLAAEQELIFGGNYEVLVRHRLDGVGPRDLGDVEARRCRFCEQTAPRTSFGGRRPAIPASLGNRALWSFEDCDDCHDPFAEGPAGDLDRFVEAVRRGDHAPALGYVPVAAFKGLVRSAIALLPEDQLQFFEDAIEWVGNPDHGLDSRTIGGTDCYVHALPEPSAFSWAALARRVEDEATMPYILAFFGVGHHVFQIPLPLSVRDEDLEGPPVVPRVASPFGVGRGPLDSHLTVVALSSAAPRRVLLVDSASR
jgi:hypothetical protein